MNKTVNKSGVKKATQTFGTSFNSTTNSIELKVESIDLLDEGMWKMFSTLLVLEYVRY